MHRRKSLPMTPVLRAGLLAAVGLSLGFVSTATAGEGSNPGIETPTAQAFLHAANCHMGQGFGMARPDAAAAIEKLLLKTGAGSRSVAR